MSLEKILERIRMIENNDFSTDAEIINEVITGSEKEIAQLFKPNDRTAINRVINKVRSKVGLGDRDYRTLKMISQSDANTREIQAAANRLFGGEGGDIKTNVGAETIPSKDEKKIHAIFSLMKKHNVLPDDLDDTTYKPKFGYIRIKSSLSKVKDTLILMNKKLISIQYNDNRLTNLVKMGISKDVVFDKRDFKDFYNELDMNKSKYGIKKTTLNKSLKIELFF